MKVLVYCFYNKYNIGDNLFIEAYKKLFPQYNFTFTGKLTEELFNNNDVLFLGGGSFLDGEPNIPRDLLEKLPSKPIVYLGVGAETSIHPWHKYLLKKAKLVYIRSIKSIDKILELNPNTFWCPDLVYAISDNFELSNKKSKSILYLPNSHVISKWNDAAWKHSAWEYFKSECSQAFEMLLDKGYNIDVFPMCNNKHHNDTFTAIEIINKMISNKLKMLPFEEVDFNKICKIISSYELVISQRYHGLVIADITQTPCINLHHHDKLKEFSGTFTKNIDFYKCAKTSILDAVDDILFVNSLQISNSNVAINLDAFENLKRKVDNVICSKS